MFQSVLLERVLFQLMCLRHKSPLLPHTTTRWRLGPSQLRFGLMVGILMRSTDTWRDVLTSANTYSMIEMYGCQLTDNQWDVWMSTDNQRDVWMSNRWDVWMSTDNQWDVWMPTDRHSMRCTDVYWQTLNVQTSTDKHLIYRGLLTDTQCTDVNWETQWDA